MTSIKEMLADKLYRMESSAYPLGQLDLSLVDPLLEKLLEPQAVLHAKTFADSIAWILRHTAHYVVPDMQVTPLKYRIIPVLSRKQVLQSDEYQVLQNYLDSVYLQEGGEAYINPILLEYNSYTCRGQIVSQYGYGTDYVNLNTQTGNGNGYKYSVMPWPSLGNTANVFEKEQATIINELVKRSLQDPYLADYTFTGIHPMKLGMLHEVTWCSNSQQTTTRFKAR